MARPARLFIAAVTVIAFSGSLVQAEKVSEVLARTPKKTGDFVAFCTDHFKDCVTIVISVDIEHLAESNPRICTIRTKDNAGATKSIVGWLAQHKEIHGKPTRTGIGAAIKALWPC
jgi:hypothetical protein